MKQTKEFIFQNALLLMRNCSFEIKKNVKTQFERHAIGCLFKVQITPDPPTSNTNKGCFYVLTLFVNFTMLFLEFPITNCVLLFHSNGWEFISDYIVTYSGQISKQITD